MESDVDEVGAEHLTELVTESLDQRVELELFGQGLSDVVDDGELRGALTRLLEQPGVLEPDAQCPGERREQTDVGVAERMLAIEVVERDHACPSVPDQQGDEDGRPRRFAGDRERVARLDAAPLHVLVDDHRFARLERDLSEPHDLDRMVDQPDASLDRVREPDLIGGRVHDPDVDRLRVEDLREALADEVVHRLHLEVLRQTTLDVVDQGELRVALPGLLEQPRVLKRDAETAGERREQADVSLAERVFSVDVLQRDPAGGFTPDDERDVDRGHRHLACDEAAPECSDRLLEPFADHERFPGFEHMCARSSRQRCRLVGEAHTTLERVRVVDHAGFPIEYSDIDALRIEDLVETVADEVVHGLHLEVLGETPLDVVDERELGVALTGLLEQPRVLERDAEAASERREQADVCLAERVLAVEVLERDAADRLPADYERDQQHRGGHLFRAPHPRAAQLGDPFLDTLVEQERLPRVHHVSAEGTGRLGVDEVADAPFDRVRPRDHPGVAIEHADVQHLRIEDFDQPVAEQVVHGLHVEVFGEAALDVVDHGQLGVALPRLFEQAGVLERDAQAACKGSKEALVHLAERALALEVLERDHAGRPARDDEWDPHRGLGPLSHEQFRLRVLGEQFLRDDVEQKGFSRFEDVLAEPDGCHRVGSQSLSLLDDVREADETVGLVEHRDIDHLGVEDLTESVPDEVVHRLHLEVLGQATLHIVDQGELGVALARLFEQTGVLQRDAQAARDRGQ